MLALGGSAGTCDVGFRVLYDDDGILLRDNVSATFCGIDVHTSGFQKKIVGHVIQSHGEEKRNLSENYASSSIQR